MDLSSFATSLITSFVIFVILVLLFTFLSQRPGNAVIYFPNLVSRGIDPWEGRRRSHNPVGWISEAVGASEADAVAAGGVDAAVYLHFLKSVVYILLLSGIALLPILLPIARTDNYFEDSSRTNPRAANFTELDKLSMGNIATGSTRLWAFLLAVYWVSIATYFILWKSYKHVSDMRAAALSSPIVKPEEFAILVRDIPPPPPDQSYKDFVDSYFRALHPDTFYKSMIVTDQKQAEKVYQEIEGYKKKLSRAEFVYAESKTASNPEGTRPTNRTGFLGLVGEKVDTIEYCNEKIKELVPKLEAEQKAAFRDKQLCAALVFFSSRSAAVTASQTLHAQLVDKWTVMEAPEPRQLIWANLPMRTYERYLRQAIVYTIVFLVVFFYMIPITFISSITTLANLQASLPFLKPVIQIPAARAVLEAYLPQLALIIFLALLPALLMFLSKAEGIPSIGHATRGAAGKYFYFIVFNVFLGVAISTTVIRSLQTILKSPENIIGMLGSNLPPVATFFLTYVALQFFVGYGLQLSRIVPLIIFNIKKKFLCKTEEEIMNAWAPGDLGLATTVPSDMLIVTISLCYSVIAPLIIPFGVAYFGIGWLVAKNQVLRVCIPSFESNGRMWPHMHTRIIASLMIYQVTMLGYIGLKVFPYAPFLIPLIPASIIFAFISHSRFYPAFAATPLEVASRGSKETPNMESVYAAFIPACMKPEKAEDIEIFEDARSQTSRTTSV